MPGFSRGKVWADRRIAVATWSEDDLRRLSDRDRDGDALLRQALESEQVLRVGVGSRGEERFAARDYVDAEQELFAAADRLAGRGDLTLPAPSVEALLEEHFAHNLTSSAMQFFTPPPAAISP